MNGHVEQIQSEIQRNLNTASETNPDLEYIVQEEIPKLQRELTNEINLRRELEGKILEQFMEQITELNDIFQEEKRDREGKEEEIVSMLKNVSGDVEQLITVQRSERYFFIWLKDLKRERNEEMILNLVEQVIERLKRDAADNEF